MKKIVLLLAAVLLYGSGEALAQAAPTYPYKTVEYIGADGRKLPGPEGADHRIERTHRDSLSGIVRVYNAAGKIKEITPYADLAHLISYGPRTTYYDNGQMHTKEDLVASKRTGEFLVFYPEGQLKRRETYAANVQKTAECFGKDGSPVAYFPYEVMPGYKGGGSEKLVQAIQANVRYPAEALRNQTQGRVWVAFRVAPNGQVEDVKIVKGVSESLDAATIEAVKKLNGITPGLQDGEAVSVTLTLPITYKISEAPARFRNRDQDFGAPNRAPTF